MRISDWSSDVCSSDLRCRHATADARRARRSPQGDIVRLSGRKSRLRDRIRQAPIGRGGGAGGSAYGAVFHGSSRLNDRRARHAIRRISASSRSEEHTSELQSLMRISYAVFCLKKKKKNKPKTKLPDGPK